MRKREDVIPAFVKLVNAMLRTIQTACVGTANFVEKMTMSFGQRLFVHNIKKQPNEKFMDKE